MRRAATVPSAAVRRAAWWCGLLASALVLSACNSPYPESQEGENILYKDFYSEPKHMDPGQCYSAMDHSIICNVLEPPFEYHYFKRPYELIPLTAREVPKAEQREVVFGVGGKTKTYKATVYTIRLKPGTRYHDHPCFVPSNLRLTAKDMRGVRDVWDIKPTATREAVAKDYVHAIRRLADPRVGCLLYATFAKHFLGMAEYRAELEAGLERERYFGDRYLFFADRYQISAFASSFLVFGRVCGGEGCGRATTPAP